jgi:apolipoprotein N-acyltransferase
VARRPAAAAAPERPRPLRLPVALAFAVASGLGLLAAFPPYDVWFLAPVAVALFAAAAHRRRLRAGFGVGFVAGAVLFLPLLAWTNLHTGWLPWVLLSLAEAAIVGLLGAASAWVSPLADRWRALWPGLTGLLWVAQEALRDRAPFGGFPWGRLAFSQGDAPALRLAALGGAPAVTCAVAVAGGALAALAWRPWRLRRRTALVPAAGFAAAAAVALPGPALIPPPAVTGPTVTVAVVQGNVPRLGLEFNDQRRRVLDNHAAATERLAADVAAGRRQQPDLVIWPENASDIDPLLNPDAAERITQAADAIRAPVLVGAVLRGPGPGQVRNAGLVWLPGTGVDGTQLYVKRHPVPFAEYVPLRRIARMVSAEVDRVSADFVAGTEPGVLRVGPVTLGDVICFEVAYDGVVRDTVTGGAQLLAVQTNNATFNDAEARQQLAMVRLRAVEHGRDALMASTVGISGFVTADGRVHQATKFNTPAAEVRELRLSGSRTLAGRLGAGPEYGLVAAAVAALVVAAAVHCRSKSAGTVATGAKPTP